MKIHLRKDDLTKYARDLGIWDTLCEAAGKPNNSEELTFICHPEHKPSTERG